MGIVIAVLMFGFMIFIHELGHFVTAKLCKVTVEEFAIGMGPKIFGYRSKKSGTLYSLRLLPLGGFTNMLGEMDETDDDEHSLYKKPCWQRFLIFVSGSLMNIISAVLALFILNMTAAGFYTTTVKGFYDADSSSYNSGLRSGDVILSINNNKVNVYTDIAFNITREGTEPCELRVLRNGEEIVLKDVVFPTDENDGILFGVMDFATEVEYTSLGVVLKQSVFQSFSTLKLMYQSLFDIITGRYGMEAVSGPIGVVGEIGEVVKEDNYSSMVNLFVFISMNLGVCNLLPIPALDGGRLIFVVLEMIRRKPIKLEYESYIHLAGMALLLIFMGVVAVFDIMRLVG